MKETLKSKKGITLIALVITIIILIILAGISISMLMGENGLITKAKQGTQNMQNAAIEEQERLNALYEDFESGVVGTGSYDAIDGLINFKRTIAEAITNAGVATSENDSAETMANNIAQAVTAAQTTGHDSGYTEGQESIDTDLNNIFILNSYSAGSGVNSYNMCCKAYTKYDGTYQNYYATQVTAEKTLLTHNISENNAININCLYEAGYKIKITPTANCKMKYILNDTNVNMGPYSSYGTIDLTANQEYLFYMSVYNADNANTTIARGLVLMFEE